MGRRWNQITQFRKYEGTDWKYSEINLEDFFVEQKEKLEKKYNEEDKYEGYTYFSEETEMFTVSCELTEDIIKENDFPNDELKEMLIETLEIAKKKKLNYIGFELL